MRGELMVYGAILEKGEELYTFLNKIFDGLNNVQKNYNWLVSDCICYIPPSETERLLSQEYCFISGEKLTEIADENFQFVWGVFSGFEKNISEKEIMKYELPYADCYDGFWKNPLSIQHPLASIEIVAWDSDLSLVLSKDKEIVDSFRQSFPLSEDLFSYNQKLTL